MFITAEKKLKREKRGKTQFFIPTTNFCIITCVDQSLKIVKDVGCVLGIDRKSYKQENNQMSEGRGNKAKKHVEVTPVTLISKLINPAYV